MSAKSPLQIVNEQHGGKDKLVDKLVDAIDSDREDEDKGEFKARLLAMANSKLLRLLASSEELGRFGGREQLVDAALQLINRQKDSDYRTKLLTMTTTQLLAKHREWERRAKRAKKAA